MCVCVYMFLSHQVKQGSLRRANPPPLPCFLDGLPRADEKVGMVYRQFAEGGIRVSAPTPDLYP